jgi:hypothetical protein
LLKRINDLHLYRQRLSECIEEECPRVSKRSLEGFISEKRERGIRSIRKSARKYEEMVEELRSVGERLDHVESSWRSYCDEEAQGLRKAVSGFELLIMAGEINEELDGIDQAITEVEHRYYQHISRRAQYAGGPWKTRALKSEEEKGEMN